MFNATQLLDLKFADLNKALRDLSEDQCSALLKEEKKKRRRFSYLMRIYGRYNTLRCERERLAIHSIAVNGQEVQLNG